MKQILILIVSGAFLYAAGGEMDAYMQQLKTEAKAQDPAFTTFDAARGEKIYFSKHIGKRGKQISCASCHTKNLRANGENIFTGKVIKPLSPQANPKRFTKVKKVKKWLRRNFKDVYKREGTAQEKGDVLTYMMQQ